MVRQLCNFLHRWGPGLNACQVHLQIFQSWELHKQRKHFWVSWWFLDWKLLVHLKHGMRYRQIMHGSMLWIKCWKEVRGHSSSCQWRWLWQNKWLVVGSTQGDFSSSIQNCTMYHVPCCCQQCLQTKHALSTRKRFSVSMEKWPTFLNLGWSTDCCGFVSQYSVLPRIIESS